MTLGTGTIKSRRNVDGGVELRIQFAGDTSYPTGGTADFADYVNAIIATAAAAATDTNVRGPENLQIVDIVGGDCGQYVPFYDIDNDKLFVRDGGHATRDEVANTTALNGTPFNVTCVCK